MYNYLYDVKQSKTGHLKKKEPSHILDCGFKLSQMSYVLFTELFLV